MTTRRFGIRFFKVTIPLLAAGTLIAADTPVPVGKRVIEAPPKAVVAATAAVPVPPAAAFDNPTVEAGKVKWHATLADAQAAAKKSGKPVLLFQMMGYLDKKFC